MDLTRRSVLSHIGVLTLSGCTAPRSKTQKSYQTKYAEAWTSEGEILPSGYKFPTVIHAESIFDNPIDTWYVYSSPYDTPHIDLLTARHIEGPYVNQGKVITAEQADTQADAPHAIYDSANDEVKLWYHETGPDGNSQAFTLLATTPDAGDGTTFTKYGNPTPVLGGERSSRWDGDEKSYMNCRRVGDYYVGVYQGRDVDANARGIGLCWSQDGINWETAAYPFGWGNVIRHYDPNISTGDADLFAPTLLRLNGEWLVLFGDESADDQAVYGFSLNQYSKPLSPDDRMKLMTVASDKRGVMMDTMHANGKQYLLYQNEIGYFDWTPDQ